MQTFAIYAFSFAVTFLIGRAFFRAIFGDTTVKWPKCHEWDWDVVNDCPVWQTQQVVEKRLAQEREQEWIDRELGDVPHRIS